MPLDLLWQPMAWQTFSKKGGGKGWSSGMDSHLWETMNAMQKSIAQLAWNMHSPSLGKEQGKGKANGCGFFAYNWKLPAYSGAF